MASCNLTVDLVSVPGALVTVTYDRDVRTSTGVIPSGAAVGRGVHQSGAPVVVSVLQNDDPSVSAESQGFATVVRAKWFDASSRRDVSDSWTVAVGSAQGAAVNLSALAPTVQVAPSTITVSPAQINQASTDASNALATANDAESKVNAAVASQDSATAQNINTGTNTAAALASREQREGIIIPNTASHADVQSALTSAASLGLKVTIAGSYTTDQTLVITSDCDLSRLTITYTGAGVACQIGTPTTTLMRRSITAPRVVNSGKTAQGWAQVAGSVGYDLVNLNSCTEVTLPFAQCFEVGLRTRGAGGGFAYNTVTIGQLDNNKINHDIVSDSTGWANQNTFIGGRLSHWNTEATASAGCRQVRQQISATVPDNNTWIGTSFEGDVPEYHLEASGTANVWMNCRWEATAPKVLWNGSACVRNIIMYGYKSYLIAETVQGGATENQLVSTRQWRMATANGTKPVVWMENQSASTNPTWVITNAGGISSGGDPTAIYTWKATAQQINGKRNTDTYDRVRVDAYNGAIRFGDGTVSPPYMFGSYGGLGMSIDGGHLRWLTHNTYDLGIVGNAPRYVRAGTAVVTGSGATGSRPTAAAAGVGATFFDTTLNKPIWSTGSAWVDATGAAV